MMLLVEPCPRPVNLASAPTSDPIMPLPSRLASNEFPCWATALPCEPSKLEKLPNRLGSSLLGSQGNAVAQQGNSLLASLLGSGTIGSLVGALAKFTGLGQGSTSNIIGTLTPLVLGLLSKHSQTQGLNAAGLASLLAGQKQNILAAMPAGLGSVLSTVSGLSGLLGSARETISTNADTAKAGITDVARSVPQTVPADRSGFPRWVIPLVIVAILAFLAYQF